MADIVGRLKHPRFNATLKADGEWEGSNEDIVAILNMQFSPRKSHLPGPYGYNHVLSAARKFKAKVVDMMKPKPADPNVVY